MTADSCPCYWCLGLPVRNPLPQSPALSLPPSLPPRFARLVFRAGCLQPCNFPLVHYGADIQGEMNSVPCVRQSAWRRARACVCLSVRVRACVRSQHMLSSVCGGSEPSLRRCTCRLRSQHKLSEYLSGGECVVLHFEHLEIGGRGELIPRSIYTHSVTTQP